VKGKTPSEARELRVVFFLWTWRVAFMLWGRFYGAVGALHAEQGTRRVRRLPDRMVMPARMRTNEDAVGALRARTGNLLADEIRRK
jgi:hypothetical protein